MNRERDVFKNRLRYSVNKKASAGSEGVKAVGEGFEPSRGS